MANPYEGIPGLDESAAQNERRRQIAEAMFARAQEPAQPFQQSGRMVVPMSWTQGLAKLAEAYFGGRGMRKAEKEDTRLASERERMVGDAMAQFRQGMEGAPAVQLQSVPGTSLGAIPAGPEQKNRAAFNLMMNQAVPENVRQVAGAEMQIRERREDKAEEREWRSEEAAMARKSKEQIEADRVADRETARQSQESFRRDMLAMQQSFSSDQNALNRAAKLEAAQMNIENRRQMKLDEARGKRDEGQRRVSSSLEALSGYYDELSKAGAAIDTEKGGTSNVYARVRASGAGQLVGGALGTEAQSIRNQINQVRPLLLNDIRQATAMGARGLDSNKELEFYLQAATDPARDIQANKAALQVLENAYGLSVGIKGAEESAVKSLATEFSESAPGTSSELASLSDDELKKALGL